MKQLSLTLLFAILFYNSQAQAGPFVLGIVDTIQSIELNERRVLNIYLPDEYADSTQKKYPVIYLLDGSANEDFVHTVGLVQFLTMIGSMPPSIVIGIANVDRKRDFTFPTTIEADKKNFPTTGGSAKFIAFLENELKPFIEKKYRIYSSTIIGQSLGGLLATEVLIEKPSSFDNYIIVSPSLWWDNESLLNRISKKKTHNKLKLFIAVGNEEQQMIDDALLLYEKLVDVPGEKKFKHVFLKDEDHLTILHNALYKAFVWMNKKG